MSDIENEIENPDGKNVDEMMMGLAVGQCHGAVDEAAALEFLYKAIEKAGGLDCALFLLVSAAENAASMRKGDDMHASLLRVHETLRVAARTISAVS